ncbi:MAG: DUF3343 domain-containing protein [Clostridia bacterium]|nr:DUF3343 domain-containing protein [Clostridia bacterium]
MNRCYVGFKSQTNARVAGRVLTENAIPSEVVKKDPDGDAGCSWALLIPCEHRENVKRILDRRGVPHLKVAEWR